MAYLDHAATTPMSEPARTALLATMDQFGNPSSLHATGRRARRVVEEAREQVAAALGARPSEIIFTSGGTESDNLAVKGIFWSRRSSEPQRNVVLASAVEHHAVLDTVEWLAAHEGAQVEWLEVNELGRVEPATLAAALDKHGDSVALATVMWANNEVGTVSQMSDLSELAAQAGVPLHTDAVQAIGHIPVHFAQSGVSAMTITGHKIGGPHSVGALVLGRHIQATPVQHGGGQERQVRSGTIGAAGIASFAAAVADVVENQPRNAQTLGELRDDLVRRVLEQVPEAIYNGDPDSGALSSDADSLPTIAQDDRSAAPGLPQSLAEADEQPSDPFGARRLPGNAHFSFPGCEGDSLLMLLDARGVECSTGSACTAGVPQPSHVLLAMGVTPLLARSSLRFSLGHTSTKADVDTLIEEIGPVVERARAAGQR